MLKQEIKYNIRVYALILNGENEVLLSDEYQMDMKMTKFPGGGMEYGEGTIDCLQREAMEEFGQSLINIRHFYTTDYYPLIDEISNWEDDLTISEKQALNLLF
jgi:8-oxo-dGTP pyrophosphatase MutT (NUDIX family)